MPERTPLHPLTIHRKNFVEDAFAHARHRYPDVYPGSTALHEFVTEALSYAALVAFPNPDNSTGTPFDPPGIRDLPPVARELVHAVDRWLAENPPTSGGVHEDEATRKVSETWSRVWNRDVDIASRMVDAFVAEYCTLEFHQWTKLVGQVVEIELGEDKDGSPIKETGELLSLCESGECILLHEDGFRRYCWPVMKMRLPTHTTAQTSHQMSSLKTEITPAVAPEPEAEIPASSVTQDATAPQKPDADNAEDWQQHNTFQPKLDGGAQ